MNSLVGRTERSEFRQLARAPELAPLGPAYGSATVEVLRPDIHFCLLVLHLASKRKTLLSAVTRERLTDAFERLKAWAIDSVHDSSHLLTLAESLLSATSVSDTASRTAEAYLLEHASPTSPNFMQRFSRVLDNTRGELRRWWTKHVPCIAIDGSDGAGKTTLIRSLLLALPVLRRAGDVSPLMDPRQQHQGIHIPRSPESSILHEREFSDATRETMTPIVAKKLYRRSWIYQIVHSALRRLTGRDRCAVDDQLAHFTTIRASIRLWCAFAWTLIRDRFARRRTLLLDRSVGSFLIRNRKGSSLSMAPTWSIISRFSPPMTTVLLAVPWSVLQTRKQEMSQSSHEAYLSSLWLLATRHRPFDVIVFDNTLPSDSAADCLLTMLGLATASDQYRPDRAERVPASREAVGREPSDVAAPDGLRHSAFINCESSSPEQEGRQPSQPEVAA